MRSGVLNRMTALALNCNGLHVDPRTPMLGALPSHGVFGRFEDRQSCVACRDKRNHRS